jgi:enamine deaminase RidA (YjgF/YER057c/UK114 family)
MDKQYANPVGQWGHHLAGVKVHHGVKCGNMIFVAGQVAFDEAGNLLFPYDLEKQTRIAMENVRRVLAELGATLADVVMVKTYYVGTGSEADWEPSIRVRQELFGTPMPPSTGIPVPTLTYPGMMTEIEVIAMVDA